MEDRFILDDQLNAVLGYGELSLLFLRLYYQVRATIPDAIIRGNVGKLIGVSRPNQRFLFYALKEEVSYSIKFSSGEKLDFNTDNDALYRTLVDQQVQRMNESPEAFSIGASVTAAKKDNSYQDVPDSMRQDDSDRDDPLFMEFHANPEEYHDIEIAQLPVSNRVINHLKGMGIHTFADLLLLKRDEVRRIPQLGEKSIGEIFSMIPRVINGSVELSPGDAIRKQNERTERELLNKQKRAACGESILQACSMQQSSEVTIIACVAFRDFVKEWIKQQADRIKNERDREIALRVLIEEQSLAVVGYDYNVTRERIRQIADRAIRKFNGSLKRATDDASLAVIDSLIQRIEAIAADNLCVIFHYLQQHNSGILQLVLSLFLNEDDAKTALSAIKRAPMPLKNSDHVMPIPVNRKCPKCGAPLMIYTANKGVKAGMKFIGCAGFKKTCDFVERYEQAEN